MAGRMQVEAMRVPKWLSDFSKKVSVCCGVPHSRIIRMFMFMGIMQLIESPSEDAQNALDTVRSFRAKHLLGGEMTDEDKEYLLIAIEELEHFARIIYMKDRQYLDECEG